MTTTEKQSRSNAYVIYEIERRAYPVSEVPVKIGRDASNDIVLRETAISRFNTEVRRENDQCIVHTTGATPVVLNGVPVVDQGSLSEGARLEIGTAVLTYTEKRLPIGVSVVERAGTNRLVRDDVANRRDTIKHPLLKGSTAEPKPDPERRAKILLLVAAVLVLLYFFGR